MNARKAQQRAAYHREHKRRETSHSTAGKTKGIVATGIAKTMCKRNRSYKHPDYAAIMENLGKRKGSTGS